MRFEKKLNCGEHTSFVIQELTSHGVGIRAKIVYLTRTPQMRLSITDEAKDCPLNI